ncbi:MAG: hypothetical protein Cons2KO_29780 [Congregibacter sp.]
MLQADARADITAKLHFVELPFNIALLMYLSREYGLPGAYLLVPLIWSLEEAMVVYWRGLTARDVHYESDQFRVMAGELGDRYPALSPASMLVMGLREAFLLCAREFLTFTANKPRQ